MKITAIWVYPIKSLRGIPLQNAHLGPQGIKHDRRFMLWRVGESGELSKIQLDRYPECSRFAQEIVGDEIHVRYQPPSEPLVPPRPEQSVVLSVPLDPDVSRLDRQVVNLHQGMVNGYRMGAAYDEWFTACFGFPVVLVYIGDERRPVLGTFSPRAQPVPSPSQQGWLSYLYNYVWGARQQPEPEPDWLTFSDMAAYLVASEKSLANVNARLSSGPVDIVRFRPNIVVDGDGEGAFDEDFWEELSVRGRPALAMTKMCNRCTSLNVDYETGRFGEGDNGAVLKRLMSDRRVDKGSKWTPVFGKYGFLVDGLEGLDVAVGDEVAVTKRTKERPVWDWQYKDSSIARFYRYT